MQGSRLDINLSSGTRCQILPVWWLLKKVCVTFRILMQRGRSKPAHSRMIARERRLTPRVCRCVLSFARRLWNLGHSRRLKEEMLYDLSSSTPHAVWRVCHLESLFVASVHRALFLALGVQHPFLGVWIMPMGMGLSWCELPQVLSHVGGLSGCCPTFWSSLWSGCSVPHWVLVSGAPRNLVLPLYWLCLLFHCQ